MTPCATWTAKVRHVSNDLRADVWNGGMHGRSLCGVVVRDEQSLNAGRYMYGLPLLGIADLPPCRRCHPEVPR